MAFFQNFPTFPYDIEGTRPNKYRLATDIFCRVKMLDSIKDQTLVYYYYDIQEGETPEMIAHKLYVSPEQHWIILMMNDIIDPYYD